MTPDELYPPTEANDGRCRCGRLAAQTADLSCEWHPAVRAHRLRRLTESYSEIPVSEPPPEWMTTEMWVLSRFKTEVSDSVVDHPAHYGGESNPYEAIKVIEAWDLGFRLGNCVKYLSRAGKKGSELEDLKKARWYLQREIDCLEREF